MMNKIYKHLLAASLLMMGGTAMAQTLNSAYFTDDYKFRHDMNPAFENKQNYITIPALGNMNVNLQGNFGYQDIVLNNPMYGQEAGAKKMTSFMNPYISADEALKGFSKSNNRIQGDVGISILSAGFKGFGGYNTIEVNAKASFGASLPYELFEFAKNTGNQNYEIGLTESGCTVSLEFSKYGDKKGSIGKPNVNAEIIFVDDNRNIVKASAQNPGNLAFKGAMNMPGYLKEPEITKEVMDDEGTLYTNDLGYMGEDGFVYLLGRKGDVINMGGIKIAPSEIEEVVAQNEMIKECACIPIPDEITGEAPKLFIVINEGFEYDEKSLYRFMLEKLEAIKVPKVVQVIDALPRTFNGKVIKRMLKEM